MPAPLAARAFLPEADFLIPGGMLAWLCDHLLEMKVEGQRGAPPRLHANPGSWRLGEHMGMPRADSGGAARTMGGFNTLSRLEASAA